jgi:hypothetical protein
LWGHHSVWQTMWFINEKREVGQPNFVDFGNTVDLLRASSHNARTVSALL